MNGQQQQQQLPNEDLIKACWPEVYNALMQTQVVGVPFTEAGGQPFINMRTVIVQQQLCISGDVFPIQVGSYNNIYSFDLQNSWRFRDRTVDCGLELVRRLVQTQFANRYAGYKAMFTYGINGTGGQQSQLIYHNPENAYLYVIDEDTAREMRNQFVFQQHILRLVRTAYTLIAFADYLFEWIGMGVDNQSVNNFRDEIYVFCGFYLQQMTSAVTSEQIYKTAIVRTDTMQLLRPNLPPQPPVRQPIPPAIEIPPLNWMSNEDVNQFVTDYREFVETIMQNQQFVRSWQQRFNEFAGPQTSITIDNEGNQPIVLWNDHQFNVRVTAIKVNGILQEYSLVSQSFPDPIIGYRCKRPQNELPWLVYRKLNRQYWVPLHSHGLTGDLNADNEFAGNNGCQAMALQFTDIEALNQQRIYFVNRAMARELLDIFERQQLISQYHEWFARLMGYSKIFCDLRLRLRNGENLIDIEWLRNGSRVLGRIAMLLTLKYDCLSRLEQIWKYSILIANVNATEQRDREHIVTYVDVQQGMYGVGTSAKLTAL